MRVKSEAITNGLAAAAIGVLQLGVAISLAALIFSGPLGQGAGRAATGFVLGTAIVSAIVGYASSMKVAISGAQDTAAIMVAAAATSIAAAPSLTPQQLLPTVFVMLAISTVMTGLIFWLFGRYELTTFVRFLPFPVISGFMAGTGWLLLRGGIEVMNRDPLHLGDLDDLIMWPSLKFLLPGLALALVMVLVLTTRVTNTLVSVAILGGAVLFHVVGRGVSSFEHLEAQGWFIGPFTDGAGWAPIQPSDLDATNWRVLFDNSLLVVAIIAVSVIGALLNLSGLEGGPDKQIDMNSELRSAGVANVISGFGGGIIGYHLLGDIYLGRQLGARGRSVPLVIALMALVTFAVGTDVIALVPRAIAGGVLAGLGINLLVNWALDSLTCMSRTDAILSGLILLVIALFGVLAGVGAGVVTAAAVFIFNYSQIDPVRHVIDAAGHSNVDRHEPEELMLVNSSGAIMAFELQGFLFFGSTTRLRRQIEHRVSEATSGASTQFVVIDFFHVSGIDSTASSGLAAIQHQLDEKGITTIWSALRPTIKGELQREHLDLAATQPDLDHAIAYCEDRLLESVEVELLETRSLGLFEGATFDGLDLPELELSVGHVLIERGTLDRDLYFVQSGKLSAWIPAAGDRSIRVRQVLPGAVLGEVAFCTGEPRTADVIVETPAAIRVLTREHFDEIVESHPHIAIAIQEELLRRIGSRISSTSAMVRDLLR